MNENKPCQQYSQESIGGCRNPRQRDRLFPPYPCMISTPCPPVNIFTIISLGYQTLIIILQYICMISTPCLPVRKVLCKDSLILLKFRFKRNGKTWIFQHYLFSLTTLVYFRKSLSRVVCESVMFVVISNQTFSSCFPNTISSPSNRRDKIFWMLNPVKDVSQIIKYGSISRWFLKKQIIFRCMHRSVYCANSTMPAISRGKISTVKAFWKVQYSWFYTRSSLRQRIVKCLLKQS